MNNRFAPPAILGAGVIVVALFAYVFGSTLLGSPADISTAASTAAFRDTIWIQRPLDVLIQGAVVLSGVLGVVVLLRGIRL